MTDSKPAEESPLAQLRKAKGWSQQDLGIRAGLHGITISEIERGATNPKLSSLEAIAKALGVPLDVVVAAVRQTPADPKVVGGLLGLRPSTLCERPRRRTA